MSRRAELRRQARAASKRPIDNTVKATVTDINDVTINVVKSLSGNTGVSRSERRARQRLTRLHNDGSPKQFGSTLPRRPIEPADIDENLVSVGGATISIQPVAREEEDAS